MYNKKILSISKSVESLRRKAIGPVKWQPVATYKMHCLERQCFFSVNSLNVAEVNLAE